MTLEDVLKAYPWFDHCEGPKFVETHRDAHRTSGHWLFIPPAISRFHKVTNNEEIWAIHAGRLLLYLLGPDGAVQTLRLGLDFAAGERPVQTVPIGWWQAAELPPGEPFAFGTNVCAPCFQYTNLKVANCGELQRAFPAHADLIRRLTREPASGAKAPAN